MHDKTVLFPINLHSQQKSETIILLYQRVSQVVAKHCLTPMTGRACLPSGFAQTQVISKECSTTFAADQVTAAHKSRSRRVKDVFDSILNGDSIELANLKVRRANV